MEPSKHPELRIGVMVPVPQVQILSSTANPTKNGRASICNFPSENTLSTSPVSNTRSQTGSGDSSSSKLGTCLLNTVCTRMPKTSSSDEDDPESALDSKLDASMPRYSHTECSLKIENELCEKLGGLDIADTSFEGKHVNRELETRKSNPSMEMSSKARNDIQTELVPNSCVADKTRDPQGFQIGTLRENARKIESERLGVNLRQTDMPTKHKASVLNRTSIQELDSETQKALQECPNNASIRKDETMLKESGLNAQENMELTDVLGSRTSHSGSSSSSSSKRTLNSHSPIKSIETDSKPTGANFLNVLSSDQYVDDPRPTSKRKKLEHGTRGFITEKESEVFDNVKGPTDHFVTPSTPYGAIAADGKVPANYQTCRMAPSNSRDSQETYSNYANSGDFDTKNGFHTVNGRFNSEEARTKLGSSQTSVMQKLKNTFQIFSFTSKEPAVKKIVHHLEMKLSTDILENQKWQKEMLIRYEILNGAVTEILDLEARSQGIAEDFEIFRSSTNARRFKSILLVGDPYSGKTIFCNLLSYYWIFNKLPFQFDVCISFRLKDLDLNTDLNKVIITFLTMKLAQYHYTETNVQEALQSISGNILLVLDGFDELSDNGKRIVKSFLYQRPGFEHSTVVVTTRPESNSSFVGYFDQVINIQPPSFKHLLVVFKKLLIPKYRIDNFIDKFGQNNMFCCLFELPSLVFSGICILVQNFHFIREITKVDTVVESIVNEVIKKLKPDTNVDMALEGLGELFFEALVRGHSSFTEQFLKKVLPDFELMIKCQIFFQNRGRDGNIWVASSKLLMVYFATKYLNRRWSTLIDNKQRIQFLRHVYCFGVCNGEYITGNGIPSCWYYVGLIPEVVLKFGDSCELNNATFEMFYDVERVERSPAFDSMNLLARVNSSFLERFSFEKKDLDDEELTNTFEDILNYLTIPDFCINYIFYHNLFENRNFLKVFVDDSDNQEIAFHCVCRSDENKKIDRIQIEFSFSVLQSISGFLANILIETLAGFQFQKEYFDMSFHEFVFTLVWSVAKSNLHCPVTLKCCGKVANPIQPRIECFTFKVFTSSKTNQTMCETLYSKLTFQCDKTVVTRCHVQDFPTEKVNILWHLQEFYKKTTNVTICLDFSDVPPIS